MSAFFFNPFFSDLLRRQAAIFNFTLQGPEFEILSYLVHLWQRPCDIAMSFWRFCPDLTTSVPHNFAKLVQIWQRHLGRKPQLWFIISNRKFLKIEDFRSNPQQSRPWGSSRVRLAPCPRSFISYYIYIGAPLGNLVVQNSKSLYIELTSTADI